MAEPFLKWAGGKRWLAPTLAAAFAPHGGRLVEPFLGSGAAFFRLAPSEALLADSNSELVDSYRAVRDHVDEVIALLGHLAVDRQTFLEVRAWRPSSMVERGVRLIFLNRTAFNGLYRVNRRGDFNVPFGCKPGTTSVDEGVTRACSKALQSASIGSVDFRVTLANCRAGDFVYLDPPYTVSHNQNGFNRYNEKLFSWTDQLALATEAKRLVELGAQVWVSNADHPTIRELYPPGQFTSERRQRASRMAASAGHRRLTSEVLIRSSTRDG